MPSTRLRFKVSKSFSAVRPEDTGSISGSVLKRLLLTFTGKLPEDGASPPASGVQHNFSLLHKMAATLVPGRISRESTRWALGVAA